MINESLRQQLLDMRAEDLRVRTELEAAGELGGPYVPRMEEVHVRNAARLRELIAEHGWPGEDIADEDGAKAAWFIAQHAIGEPEFQRRALVLLQSSAAEGRAPRWHAAFLEDRIALHESRPQRFGTQWIDDPGDGRARPWRLADPERVNDLRASVGLGPMHAIPDPGPPLAEEKRRELEETRAWWEQWLRSKGWQPASGKAGGEDQEPGLPK
ncbi:MAG TPA: DUF6624 domain-containing protein [Terracidiphilus sp.]|jgi:hypothetical protein